MRCFRSLAALHVDDQFAVTDGSSCLSRLSWSGSKTTVMVHSPLGRLRRLSAVAANVLIEFEIFVDFPVADMSVEASEFEPLHRREDPHKLRA